MLYRSISWNTPFTLRGRTISTVDLAEITKFGRLSGHWKSRQDEFRLLYALNPLRIHYLLQNNPIIKDKKVLDVGCGGGIFSLPVSRLGAKVLAIDPCKENIVACRDMHESTIDRENLNLLFENMAIEGMEGSDQFFDIVLASEVIEHVQDPINFLQKCLQRLNPNGVMFISTINNTFLAKLLTKTVAEDILKIVPSGTHDPEKFVSPSLLYETIRTMNGAGSYKIDNVQGVAYLPIVGRWVYTPFSLVNYFSILRRSSHG